MKALRDRQLSSFALNKSQALFATFFCALIVIPLMGNMVWAPLFERFIPLEVWNIIIPCGSALYISQCADRVEQGKERAQLFMGAYTGESFSAGICFQPKIPLPIVRLLLSLMLPKHILDYVAWVLEGDVSVQSIAVRFDVEGMTRDGIRVRTDWVYTFEVMNAAAFLSQLDQNGGRENATSIIQSSAAVGTKREVIRLFTCKELQQAEYASDVARISAVITESCGFVKDFGLFLARCSLVNVKILSEKMEAAFDALAGSEILDATTEALATRFRKFKETLGPSVSEEVARSLFYMDHIEGGGASFNIDVLKIR